ncbi:MAG: PD-(D/E)XK nuclease family protein [Clostridiales bacterium]
MTDIEIEDKIKEFFEDNYEILKLDAGHAITEDVKNVALQQVLYYFRKLRSIAEKVTETEVKLTLPDQVTKKGRRFTIEGIVDILREDNEVWMYDIKTHDPKYIEAYKENYEKQLNIYAYIWENLRNNQLDHTAIISTVLPDSLRRAEQAGNMNQAAKELLNWQPVIEIEYDRNRVAQTIEDFADTVDAIEEGCFNSKPTSELKSKISGTNQLFATYVCRNCDARFSCGSFREYAIGKGGKLTGNFAEYYSDFGDGSDQENWINGNINIEIINNRPEINK